MCADVDSNEGIIAQGADISPRLRSIVDKYRDTVFRKPISEHTQHAFDLFQQRRLEHRESRLILDSCCGTAQSSITLALQNHDALVVGIDRSAVRLSRALTSHNVPDNVLILRAECGDFWRLCHDTAIRFDLHTLLYPNPYPKTEHLMRRWYAHPLLHSMFSLSQTLELRTNMRWYAHDFLHVAEYCQMDVTLCELSVDAPLTAFERKYAAGGEQLWQVWVRKRAARTIQKMTPEPNVAGTI